MAAAATQRPNADRHHHTRPLIVLPTSKRQHFHALFFLSTVFIQMSETLSVTKMTLNEQHCTMNKRVICQLFFGFRDNYTKRLTCHHREKKRETQRTEEKKRNCSTQVRKDRNDGKGKNMTTYINKQNKRTHSRTYPRCQNNGILSNFRV